MKEPLISVVIPAFNEEKYLPKCLESIKKQSFKDYEIIVVDNNSTDKTAEIARSFGARVVRETVQGLVPARERGFREAKAEIIARTDADTIVPVNWLEKIYSSFQSHPDAIALTGPIFNSLNIFNIFGMVYSILAGKLFSFIIGQDSLLGPNMALKKSVWEKIQVCSGWSGIIEDFDLSYHLSKYGKIVFIKDLKVVSSTRRVMENPIRGLYRYLIVYLYNFYKTYKLHS